MIDKKLQDKITALLADNEKMVDKIDKNNAALEALYQQVEEPIKTDVITCERTIDIRCAIVKRIILNDVFKNELQKSLIR